MGTGDSTSRGFDGFLGLGFLDDLKHRLVPLSLRQSIFVFQSPFSQRSWAVPCGFSQKRTSEISTDLAVNFHFSLALEWVANVEWA